MPSVPKVSLLLTVPLPPIRLQLPHFLHYTVFHLLRIILELLDLRNECFANWVRICDPDEPLKPPDYRKLLENIAPPLYYASLSGLLGVTKLLLDRGADANALGGEQGDALHAAAFHGHETVVRLPARMAPILLEVCGDGRTAGVRAAPLR